jgi:hypothetical protein
MIINRKSVYIFTVAIITYLIAEIFFNSAILYLVGGVISIFLPLLGIKEGTVTLWLVLLLLTCLAYYRVRKKWLQIILIILIWILLYLIDMLLYEIMPDAKNIAIRYSNIIIASIVKSLLISYLSVKRSKF